MKFNIPSKLLLNHLNAVSKVISNKNAYAILDNFLFELDSEHLVITGCDMETRMTTVIDVPDAEGKGCFALDVKRLLNLLKEMPETALEFMVDDETLQVNIKYLNGTFDVMALKGDEYPLKAQPSENVHELKLNQRDVADGIQHCLFAVGDDEMRPVFMGVYFDIEPERITFVASDSHKLVRYRRTEARPGETTSFILPAKPAAVLASILDRNSEEPLLAIIDDASATFEVGTYQLTCRFINGKYPPYNAVIPENNPYNLVIDRLAMLNAMRRVSVFASAGGLVSVEITADNMKIVGQDIDHSTSGVENVNCEYDGEPMSIGFKNEDVLEVLSNIASETVTVKLSDPTRAALFVPQGLEAGEDLLILQMPMMV